MNLFFSQHSSFCYIRGSWSLDIIAMFVFCFCMLSTKFGRLLQLIQRKNFSFLFFNCFFVGHSFHFRYSLSCPSYCRPNWMKILEYDFLLSHVPSNDKYQEPKTQNTCYRSSLFIDSTLPSIDINLNKPSKIFSPIEFSFLFSIYIFGIISKKTSTEKLCFLK